MILKNDQLERHLLYRRIKSFIRRNWFKLSISFLLGSIVGELIVGAMMGGEL